MNRAVVLLAAALAWGAAGCPSSGSGGDTCAACPAGQACRNGECVPAVATAKGKLVFEALYPDTDANGVSLVGPADVPAAGLPVAVVDADGEVVAEGEADADGAFSLALPEAIGSGWKVLLTAVLRPAGATRPVFAVLRPARGGEVATFDLSPWSWSVALPASGDVGTVGIGEDQGSGAVFLYQYGMSALWLAAEHYFGGDLGKLASVAMLWAPGVTWECVSCYSSVTPQYDDDVQFAQSIFLDGAPDGVSAWGYPSVLHELGHYVLQSYGRNNSPGGTHAGGDLLAPPWAWAEGWATFFAVSSTSLFYEESSPLYWDIAGGSSFWVDVEAARYDSSDVEAPNPNGSQTQNLEEYWVAHMLWHLWDGVELAEPQGRADGTALGEQKVLAAIRSDRFRQKDRGATGADFVDFADAVICASSGLKAGMTATIREMSFPYDGQPVCN